MMRPGKAAVGMMNEQIQETVEFCDWLDAWEGLRENVVGLVGLSLGYLRSCVHWYRKYAKGRQFVAKAEKHVMWWENKQAKQNMIWE